ncbi:MAG: hypothetical protein WAK20_09885 [Candidatus Acidiferrum sp.]
MITSASDAGQRYDLAVAYRIYPEVSRPAQSLPFGDDKLKQAGICLRSFHRALGSLRAKIWVILDGCPKEYRLLFEDLFPARDLVFVDLNRAGNKATYAKQIEVLLAQDDAGYVYLAEDDYFYLPDQFALMLGFLSDRQDVDFVTPYDHPDCYTSELHRGPKSVTVFEGHHWRTAASTCLTFLTRKRTLAKYERVFKTYLRRNEDCAIWLSLTKWRVFNPLAALRYYGRREIYRKTLLKAWFFCWRQILFGDSVKLWVPVPGIATHLSAGLLSPCRDWLTLMHQMENSQGTLQSGSLR